MCVSIYPPPPLAKAECDGRLTFKRSLTGLNSVFILLNWLPTQC